MTIIANKTLTFKGSTSIDAINNTPKGTPNIPNIKTGVISYLSITSLVLRIIYKAKYIVVKLIKITTVLVSKILIKIGILIKPRPNPLIVYIIEAKNNAK